MTRRGFTAVELAICLSCMAILLPFVYALAAGIDDSHALGLWHVETAEGVRAVTEELRLDARRAAPEPGPELVWSGDCKVRYRVTDTQILLREAAEPCGGNRGLASHVAALERKPGGVDIVFSRRLRPDRDLRSTVSVAVEGL